MKVARIWVNDLPSGYEVVLGMQCQDCKYTDSIRIPYTGHKQLVQQHFKADVGVKGPEVTLDRLR